ncbi:hypothetical protein C8R45DRAFT_1174835 [Mycena sanguinolenta]|nr:hypothetical protein C8R45DRAFT_1174835 [Mycena sanguinolenta]
MPDSPLPLESIDSLRIDDASLDEDVPPICNSVAHSDNAISSVVQRLPPEILCEVFLWTVPYECTRTLASEASPTAPWWLTHVSQTGRAAARGYAKLWRCIHIKTRRVRSTFSACYPLAALKTQPRLSADVPPDIKFEKCGRNPEFDHAYAAALLAALVPHSNRWKRLSLSFGLGGRGAYVLSGIRGNLAQLHRLEITDPHVAGRRWPSCTRDIFEDAPQLRATQLMSLDPDLDSPLISVPWHQLTELRVRWEAEHFFANMRKAHRVVDCAVDMSEGEIFVYAGPRPQPVMDTSVIELPNLRHLFVGGERPLRFLEAPKLRSLHMQSMFDGDVVPAFLGRSQCRFQTLKINGLGLHKIDSLFTSLREVPTLANMSRGLDRAAQGIYRRKKVS